MPTRRTTLAADPDDLALLEGEARRRGVSLAQVLRELVAREAAELRLARRPRFGVARTSEGAARAAAADEEAPLREGTRTQVALVLDAGDPDHARSVTMVGEVAEDLVVPAFVLVEIDYWARKLLGQESWQIFVEDVASGAYRLEPPTVDDLRRAAELERAYCDLDLGLVDASVIALCERLGETKVATLDRRHFSVVRPRHCDSLLLLPA